MRLTGYIQKIEAQRVDSTNPKSAQVPEVVIKVHESHKIMYDSFAVPNLGGFKLNDEVDIEVTARED